VVRTGDYLVSELNKLDGIGITPIENGSNIYDLKLSSEINQKALTSYLYSTHNISLGRANEQGLIKFKVNETLLSSDIDEVVAAWNNGIDAAS